MECIRFDLLLNFFFNHRLLHVIDLWMIYLMVINCPLLTPVQVAQTLAWAYTNLS